MHSYVGRSSSRLGWEEFASIVEELAAVGRMTLESERKIREVDLRSMIEWDTMLGGGGVLEAHVGKGDEDYQRRHGRDIGDSSHLASKRE